MKKHNSRSCGLYINVCVKDLPYLDRLVPHMVKGCNYAFDEVFLVIDTSALIGSYVESLQDEAEAKLRELARCFLDQGLITRIIYLPYTKTDIKRVYRAFFGKNLRVIKDQRGAPFYGYLYPLLEMKSEYVVHLDSDMLIYTDPEYSWVAQGIELMDSDDDVFVTTPLSGPPRADGTINQPIGRSKQPNAYFSLKIVTTRKHLINREKLLSLCPLEATYTSRARKYLSFLTGRSALRPWELQLTHYMNAMGKFRADLRGGKSWTLHTPDHGQVFLRNLDRIIERVEQNDFPLDQAGKFDLDLELWT